MVNQKIIYKDLGLIDFREAWIYQEKLFNEILSIKERNLKKPAGEQELTPNYLLFCEHPHVYTLGKSGSEANLLVSPDDLKIQGVALYRINRGGDITYHGPGQIVGYPIIDMDNFKLSVKRYIFNLEEAIVLTLKELGITAGRLDGATGVWLDAGIPHKARKICAIGVRTSHWVTMHGFAFNVNTDLNYFNSINPCGFTDKAVTSLEKEKRHRMDTENVKAILVDNICRVFGMDLLQ
ncbi:MAG: lipoyl(octanoyl) transferase LipB [Bacteroidetes bacterium]|nr:lipoyl(octanoyl) transferase LipB [Bacteroidota bacterium]